MHCLKMCDLKHHSQIKKALICYLKYKEAQVEKMEKAEWKIRQEINIGGQILP